MQGSYSLLSVNLYYIVNLYLAYTVTNSDKNLRMFVYGCLFYQKIHSHHQLNLCYPEYSREYAPVLELAVGCFPLI